MLPASALLFARVQERTKENGMETILEKEHGNKTCTAGFARLASTITFCGTSMALRRHAIFARLFADIADYIENTENPALDLMNVRDILGDTSFWLR